MASRKLTKAQKAKRYVRTKAFRAEEKKAAIPLPHARAGLAKIADTYTLRALTGEQHAKLTDYLSYLSEEENADAIDELLGKNEQWAFEIDGFKSSHIFDSMYLLSMKLSQYGNEKGGDLKRVKASQFRVIKWKGDEAQWADIKLEERTERNAYHAAKRKAVATTRADLRKEKTKNRKLAEENAKLKAKLKAKPKGKK